MKGNLDPRALLQLAQDVIAERGANYGEIENNFQLIADLATLRLGRAFHPYEICVVLACVKHARNFSFPDHLDSTVDGANYELFSAQFAADYIAQKAATGGVEGYKKRTELQTAEIAEPARLKATRAPMMPKADLQTQLSMALGKLDAE